MKKLLLLLLVYSSHINAQLNIQHPKNVRYIAGGYTDKEPYFSTLEKALNNVKAKAGAESPYVFSIDSDTVYISDWRRMRDSINNHYVSAGKIKWAGFANEAGGYNAQVLYPTDERTAHYGYPKWKSGSYSPWYDSLSHGITAIDKNIYDLIVYTDSAWLYVENDTLKLKAHKIAPISSGTESFTGTSVSDTLFIPGAKASDIYFVSPAGPCPTCESEVLRVEAVTNKAIVWRNSGGTSGLKYYWIRIAK